MIIVIVTEREEKRSESREQRQERRAEKENEKENEGRERRREEKERMRGEREAVLRFSTPPCVHSKGLRVYWQNARMCST